MSPFIRPIHSAALSEYKRGLLYGDGFFETMKIERGVISYWYLHWFRILQTADFLNISLNFTQEALQESILDFIKPYVKQDVLRVRLNFIRQSDGYYSPGDPQSVGVIGEVTDLPHDYTSPQKKGLIVDLSSVLKPIVPLSNYKTLNALPYVLAANEARSHQWDEAVILNTEGRVAESTARNIFIRTGDAIITSPLSEGCLNGVMRAHFIQYLKDHEIKIAIRPVHLKELEQADEIILTNVLSGLQYVSNMRNTDYQSTFTFAHAREVMRYRPKDIDL
ncbi:MAG: aminotransferase class IV [Flavobacteriales bacterium]|nr:aminotransferase class IV [Flavobacteriales bacterium]